MADPGEREADRIGDWLALGGARPNPPREVPRTDAGVDRAFLAELASTTTRGRPIPASLRHRFEARLGSDLEDVRLHTDRRAARLAERIDARAFTYGSEVFFGPGAYDPSSLDGQRLLAHEVVHTAQQSGAPIVQRDPDPPAAESSEWSAEAALAPVLDALRTAEERTPPAPRRRPARRRPTRRSPELIPDAAFVLWSHEHRIGNEVREVETELTLFLRDALRVMGQQGTDMGLVLDPAWPQLGAGMWSMVRSGRAMHASPSIAAIQTWMTSVHRTTTALQHLFVVADQPRALGGRWSDCARDGGRSETGWARCGSRSMPTRAWRRGTRANARPSSGAAPRRGRRPRCASSSVGSMRRSRETRSRRWKRSRCGSTSRRFRPKRGRTSSVSQSSMQTSGSGRPRCSMRRGEPASRRCGSRRFPGSSGRSGRSCCRSDGWPSSDSIRMSC